MKAMQKIVGSLIVGCVLACWLTSNICAQTTAKAVQAVSAEDMAVMLQAVEATTPVAAESVPLYGTFYSALHANWVPLPANINNVPAWSLGDGIWLLDDLDQPQAHKQTMAGNMMAMEAPAPGVGGTNSYTANESSFVLPDYGTNLWIAQVGISSRNLVGIVSNSQPDISYEIQSITDPAQAGTGWNSEGFILGSELTNWTPMNVAQGNRTNLIVRIRSWADSTGSGIPDWWWLQYFGSVGGDPYGNPAGDGWNNLQKFQNGMNPSMFYTPPAPQLAVSYDVFSRLATVSWTPKLAPATSYTVERFDDYYIFTRSNIFNLSGSVNSLQDNLGNGYDYVDLWGQGLEPTIGSYYRIQAHYAVGDSAWSGPVYVQPGSYASISAVPGPQGSAYLAVASLPAGTTTLRVTRIDLTAGDWNDYSFNATNNIPVSASTNGLHLLPAFITASPMNAHGCADYWWYVEPLNGTGEGVGGSKLVSSGIYSQEVSDAQNWMVSPWFDGRTQLKQNLIFKLRAATVDSPFRFSAFDSGYGYQPGFTNQSSYVSASFFQEPIYYLNGNYITFDPLWPFGENILFRNFVFSLPDVTPTNWSPYGLGHIQTGVHGSYDDYYDFPSIYPTPLILTEPATYQFTLNTTNGGTIPALLLPNSTHWLCSYPLDSTEMYGDGENIVSTGYLEQIGVTPSVQTDWQTYYNTFYTMASNARNYWGLPFLSVTIAYGNSAGTATETTILNAGSQEENVDGYFYPETAQPQFQTVEYDFWSRSPLPESTNFSTSQTSDLLITSVGTQIQIAGYAKLAVLNGYSGVYAYLGQYFDQAYTEDTNGVATTNTTGVLSPYGSFFATEPGPAALVTMPDVDTGERGTCTVYCVSLVLDKNHDGTMDLSFNGPDATSPNSPYIFWVNNNYDRWATNTAILGLLYTDIEQDDQKIGFCPAYPGTLTPDCNYSNVLVNGYAYRAIPCTRDLQDFFRLWVCGIDTNLIAKLPAGSTITLNWGDVGSPNSGNPTIDIFTAADPDGGIGYLTNETVATTQINAISCPYIGRLAPGGSIQLNASQFANGWAGNHFIMCGVNYGTGGLNLTIADGSGNVLAQSTTYIQIVDIKQMYERWTVGDNPNNPSAAVPYPATENLPPFTPAFQYPQPQDTNTTYILHVHGFNMDTWEKDRYAETEFKRLYWQGYKGRFGEFRWPTTTSFYPKTFDDSESNAWASAKGLLNLLTNLNAEYPGHVYLTAHSHGNVVAGEALRLAGNNHIVNTYVAMQGAIASHAYDPTTPVRTLDSTGVNLDSGTPNRYAHYYTDSSPCYFNSSAGAGAYVDFFNTNDWALTQLWRPDEDLKPDTGYGWDGTNFYSGTIFHLYLLFPVDTYAIFSYCDEARCQALGAQVNVGGVFSTSRQIDLRQPPYNFGDPHIYHSGEFRSDYAQRWQFWDEVLVQMGLK